jgi:flagellar protein FliO/FliZ
MRRKRMVAARAILATAGFSGILALTTRVGDAATSQDIGFVNPWAMWLRLFLALAVIIAIAVFTIRWLGQKTGVRQVGGIEVLAARQLAPGRFVEVIDVQGKRYLIGVGEQVTLLADVTDDFRTADEWAEADLEAFAAETGQLAMSSSVAADGTAQSMPTTVDGATLSSEAGRLAAALQTVRARYRISAARPSILSASPAEDAGQDEPVTADLRRPAEEGAAFAEMLASEQSRQGEDDRR